MAADLTSNSVELIPSARRLVQSLRDIGYDLPSAVADIIDNSIAAQATEVRVDLAFQGEESWVSIADNGTGMGVEALTEAMRYGTQRDYSESELGKFGLGLKTASMSQCRRLTVATRSDPKRRAIEIRQWDLDHIERVDRWEILRVSPARAKADLVDPLRLHPGTVVLWEHLDRVLRYKIPEGQWALDGFARLCRLVEDHLSMVFHRFVSGEARRALPLVIYVNGNRLGAWDPFSRSEPATKKLTKQSLALHHAGRNHRVTLQPFILPNEAEFSSPLAHKRAGGPKRWNHQQGLYIYRNDRLIQSGGWNRIRTPDEHTKLARIAMDFPSAADSAFELNVAKMQVRVPDELRNQLTALISSYASAANAAYRKNSGAKGRQTVLGKPDKHGDRPTPRPRGRQRLDSEPVKYLGHSALRGVKEIVRRELRDQPRLLDRVLTGIDRFNEDLVAELQAAVGSLDIDTEAPVEGRKQS